MDSPTAPPPDPQQMFDQAVPHCIIQQRACVRARRHQTRTADMMHGLCLIIEMLNKYLQMADPSSAVQGPTIVINEPSARAQETAVTVPVRRLDIISHLKHVKVLRQCCGNTCKRAAAAVSSGCICSEFKQVLQTALTGEGASVVLASKAARSCQIRRIPVRGRSEMDYIKVSKLWPGITLVRGEFTQPRWNFYYR